jgi:tRNA nucleotidyltransferase/poly(A) polymerase
MGRESLDIDIALDNMMGKEFAERVNSYLESRGKETHNVAVIMSNPDQSKHLETARMKIRGLWIDLVNLRSEEYAHNSRIPTMTFGTPEQDAFRRDFTINSLFYNINTKEVEDYTGKGIEDMKLGVIRTPLPAKETFLDDPLRVLRAVRFASRFGFALDESLVEAASDDKVRCVVICDLCFVLVSIFCRIRAWRGDSRERKGSCRGWQPNWSALMETTPSRDDLLVFQRRFHGGMKGNEE